MQKTQLLIQSLIICYSEEDGERRERKKVDSEDSFDFKSYPNPVRNTLYLEWSYVLNTTVRLHLLNQEGQSILKKEVLAEGRIFELPLNNLAEGVYVLEVEKDGEVIRKKNSDYKIITSGF